MFHCKLRLEIELQCRYSVEILIAVKQCIKIVFLIKLLVEYYSTENTKKTRQKLNQENTYNGKYYTPKKKNKGIRKKAQPYVILSTTPRFDTIFVSTN